MSRRFFVESPISDSQIVKLAGQEAQHLGKVLRAKTGDQVVLFDGEGAEFTAEVSEVGRSEVSLKVLQRHDIDRESPQRVVLAVAMPKGDRQKWLVEKTVELGVQRLIPLTTTRGVAQPTGSTLKRLERAVIEASKQCGRNRLMEIAPPMRVQDLLQAAAPDAKKWIAHPSGDPLPEANGDEGAETWVAVGPEGGFTDEEFAAAEQGGWQAVQLGKRILRVETAALFLAARLT